ncbi:MAG: hypothetical protein IJD37_03790 [Clostridia bacterium]|nr:hypothetical protein [Clostridia bacterium]
MMKIFFVDHSKNVMERQSRAITFFVEKGFELERRLAGKRGSIVPRRLNGSLTMFAQNKRGKFFAKLSTKESGLLSFLKRSPLSQLH